MKRRLLTKQRTFRLTDEADGDLRLLASATQQHEAALIRTFVAQAVSYYKQHPEELSQAPIK